MLSRLLKAPQRREAVTPTTFCELRLCSQHTENTRFYTDKCGIVNTSGVPLFACGVKKKNENLISCQHFPQKGTVPFYWGFAEECTAQYVNTTVLHWITWIGSHLNVSIFQNKRLSHDEKKSPHLKNRSWTFPIRGVEREACVTICSKSTLNSYTYTSVYSKNILLDADLAVLRSCSCEFMKH